MWGSEGGCNQSGARSVLSAMSPRLPRRQAERRGLRLWPVGIVLVLAFTVAVLVAAAVFYAGWDLLDAHRLKPEPSIDSKTLFDLVKLAFGVVAGAGALVALVVAYRRQRVDDDGALRDATRLHTERFTTAVSQLGEESAAIRLGGVHALSGLADDAPTRELRQTCIDVLCAYLRLPYTAEADLPANDAEARHTYLALREVRHTVIRLIRDHLRLSLEHHHSWQGHDFDFTGVMFDGGDLSQAVFSGSTVTFSGATFSGDTVSFSGTVFSDDVVDFSGTVFSGDMVNFSGTEFSGDTVSFNGATFSGKVYFDEATSSGTIDFNGATFSGGTFSIGGARLSGSTVDFSGALFSGGTATFSGTRFSGSTFTFRRAVFSDGAVDFGAAVFSDGAVDFSSAVFSGGTVDFSEATGPAPRGLIPASRTPLPDGLILAAAWQPTDP